MINWLPIFQMSIPFLLLFAFAEVLFHRGKLEAETTRKIVHIGTGLLTLLFPDLFHYLWQVSFICVTFLIILLLSMQFNMLPSINAVKRKTWGSILFPTIVIVVFAFYLFMQQKEKSFNSYLFFCLPILIMAIADPIAAAVGRHYKRDRPVDSNKTFAGSVAFFITAFLLSQTLMSLSIQNYMHRTIWYALLLSFGTTIAERISNKGWDNFTIPLTTAVLLYLIA